MTQDPEVSVILPVHNAERYLKHAIESVFWQNLPLELVLVDDGSTDGSGAIARSYAHRINYIQQKNAGAAAARNRGMAAASGQFLAFIDADDIWPQDKLSWQLEVLKSSSRACASLGTVQMFSGSQVGTSDSAPSAEQLSEPFFSYLFGALVLKRSVIDKTGLLDEGLSVAEDFDWFLRMRENGTPIVHSKRVSLFYRLQSDSLTAGKNLIDRKLPFVLKQSLDRRRLVNSGKALPLQDEHWGLTSDE